MRSTSVALADDHLADLVDRLLDLQRLLAHGLVQLRDVHLGSGHGSHSRARPRARTPPARRGTRRPGRKTQLAPVAQVPDLALEERAPAPELRHVPTPSAATAARGGAGQLRLPERDEAAPAPAASSRRSRRGCPTSAAFSVASSRRWRSCRSPPDYTDSAFRPPEIASPMTSKTHYRVVILGSGPAGLTAARLRLARGARAARGRGRRRRRPDRRPRRPADAHDRGRQLPRLPRGDPRPRADGAHAQAGRALRRGVRDRRGEVGAVSASARSAAAPRRRRRSPPTR